ncbi:MAG: hypothetical protein J4473_00575 [Candidatus Aenigmarchaeota archaeon]|nr:hypothetical protein [Candidatus Aenigmarchaeota archaeon]
MRMDARDHKGKIFGLYPNGDMESIIGVVSGHYRISALPGTRDIPGMLEILAESGNAPELSSTVTFTANKRTKLYAVPSDCNMFVHRFPDGTMPPEEYDSEWSGKTLIDTVTNGMELEHVKFIATYDMLPRAGLGGSGCLAACIVRASLNIRYNISSENALNLDALDRYPAVREIFEKGRDFRDLGAAHLAAKLENESYRTGCLDAVSSLPTGNVNHFEFHDDHLPDVKHIPEVAHHINYRMMICLVGKLHDSVKLNDGKLYDVRARPKEWRRDIEDTSKYAELIHDLENWHEIVGFLREVYDRRVFAYEAAGTTYETPAQKRIADFVYERGGAVRGMGAGGTVCGAFFLDYDDLLEAYERFGHDNDVKILDIKIREDSNHYTHQKLSNNL